MRSTTLILFATAMVFAAVSTAAQAQKNPAGVNPTHYQCYRVVEETKFKPRDVKLRDQFGAAGATVVVPELICAPTVKNNLKPRDTRTHYVCYVEKRPSPRKRVVEVRNQFGRQILVVTEPRYLCVPSLKRVLKK